MLCVSSSAPPLAGFEEETKVNATLLDPAVFPNAAALEDPAALGRLAIVGDRFFVPKW